LNTIGEVDMTQIPGSRNSEEKYSPTEV
jgi:hypothetical protein